jgi:hypothetical protein
MAKSSEYESGEEVGTGNYSGATEKDKVESKSARRGLAGSAFPGGAWERVDTPEPGNELVV